MAKKPKRGRPRKPKDAARTETIECRVTADEKARAESLAADQGRSIAGLIRWLLFGRPA